MKSEGLLSREVPWASILNIKYKRHFCGNAFSLSSPNVAHILKILLLRILSVLEKRPKASYERPKKCPKVTPAERRPMDVLGLSI